MRWIVFLALALAPLGASRAQSCEEAQQKLVDLQQRVESLERQLAQVKTTSAKAAVPAAPAAPAANAAGAAAAARPAPAQDAQAREDALALYKKVDELVAAGNLEQANREVAAWDEKHAGTPAAGWTRALNRELAVVGKAAPTNWAIDHWYQGESDVKLDGQHATLLVFWEAWCPHCKDEVPKLQKLWENYSGKGLQVLGVTRITQTATEEMVKSFLASSGVRYPMAKETGDLATYFDVKGIPAAALVKDGKVVWRGHPIRLTDELLDVWF